MRHYLGSCLMLAVTLAADLPVRPLTDADGIEVTRCHPGDEVQVHVVPVPLAFNRVEGWFSVTNEVLTLRSLSMLPDGTNRLEIATVCRGQTSEVRVVMIDIRRRPRMPEIRVRSLTQDVIFPPMPIGMVMPLPRGTNDDYAQFQRRIRSSMRRNQ